MALRQVLNSVSKRRVNGRLANFSLNKCFYSILTTATSKRKLI